MKLDTPEHAGYRAEILAYGTQDPADLNRLLRRQVDGLEAEAHQLHTELADMNWHMMQEHGCKHADI